MHAFSHIIQTGAERIIDETKKIGNLGIDESYSLVMLNACIGIL
jgi:hypothetical protein